MNAWKITQLVGVLLLLIGVVVRVGGQIDGTAVALLGLVLFAVGRIGGWLKSDGP